VTIQKSSHYVQFQNKTMHVTWLVKYQYAATLFITIVPTDVTCFY